MLIGDSQVKTGHLQIKTQNMYHATEQLVRPLIERLKGKGEIEGIVTLGGLGKRRFSDVHSDIDIPIFVRGIPGWLPPFEFHVPDRHMKGRFWEINVHQATVEGAYAHTWPEGKKQAYMEGVVAQDPSGCVRSILQDRCRFDTRHAEKRTAELTRAITSFTPAGNPMHDHLAVNKIMNQVTEIIYLSKGRFRPHKKWRLARTAQLVSQAKAVVNALEDAMLVKSMDLQDVLRRLDSLNRVMRFPLLAATSRREHVEPPLQAARHFRHSKLDIKRMLVLMCGQLHWTIDVNPSRQLDRGFPACSHDLLNEGLVTVLECARVASERAVRQNVEALNVLCPSPLCDESQYDLWCDFANLEKLQDRFIDALLVPDLSASGVKRRVDAVQSLSHAFLLELKRQVKMPDDPYHFALKYCYPDRQLTQEPFAERICPESLGVAERKFFVGFVSYHLAASFQEIRRALADPTPGVYSPEHLATVRQIMERIDDA